MIKIVDRYMGHSALLGVLGVWAGLTVLMAMFTFLDQLGDGGGSLGEVLTYVALKSVNGAYIVFPVAALLGAMIGVGGLAAGNELVALRTSGVSRLRLSGSVLGAVFLLTMAVMVIGEWVMPAAEQQARTLRLQAIEGNQDITGGFDIWIRDGQDFIHIRRSIVDDDDASVEMTLVDVVRYRFDAAQTLAQVDYAESATYDGEAWRLRGTEQTRVTADGIETEALPDQAWAAGFEPGLLSTAIVRPRYMSIRDIREQVSFLEQNGLDSTSYTSVLWTKLLLPLSVLALVLAGMPFLFGAARTQSLGVRIFIGMSLGGVFMIVAKTMQNFSEAYDLPSWLGASLPSLVLATVVVIVLKRSV
ncbi:MAG: LPS export ABC transporter permease LptG [Pseudomonadota bacterium]